MTTRLVPLDRQRLAEHGVDLVKAGGGWRLVCQQCGHSWPVPTHVIPRNYWICPAFWCNADAGPTVRTKPKPEPEPEAEADPEKLADPRYKGVWKEGLYMGGDYYPIDVKARHLENRAFYLRMAKEAKDEEARKRFERQAGRYLEMYLALVHDEEVEQ